MLERSGDPRRQEGQEARGSRFRLRLRGREGMMEKWDWPQGLELIRIGGERGIFLPSVAKNFRRPM
jgi:hypothetical protein